MADPTGDGGLGGPDGGPGADPSAELYDLAAFPRFDLDIPQASLDALAADPGTYATATFHYGDEVVANVGVELGGEYTFRALPQKASFKIAFDAFVPGQSFHGLHHIKLKNEIEDPSFLAERATYLAFRAAGLPAPRQNSAQVYVNGEYYGVYGNLEVEDKVFLRRWFANNDGNVYEELGQDWYPGNENGFELETNETVNDRSDLTALFAAVDAAAPDTLLADVSAILDTDRFLRYCAVEGLVDQWDGYAYTMYGPNNYRLYHDPSTGQFSILPWGMDMTWKPLDANDYVDLYAPAGYFLQRCLNESTTCKAAFDAVLAEEIDRLASDGLAQVVQDGHDLIAAQVDADPKKEISNDDFEGTFAVVLDLINRRPDAARAQLPQ